MSKKNEIGYSNLTKIKPVTDHQKQVFESWKKGQNQFLFGCAGTGKTFVSLYLALQDVLKNEMPQDIIENSIKKFCLRIEKIDWQTYYLNLPFNESCLALYDWSPVADELKTLDKKIVLNSMILKWDNVKKEFINLINL